QFGSPSDLNAARRPGIDALEIVDHKSDPRVSLQIVPFLRGTQAMTADLDRMPVRVEAKAHGHDVRRAIAADRSKPPQPLPTQILGLLLGEIAHGDLLRCRAGYATFALPIPGRQATYQAASRPAFPIVSHHALNCASV